jgi:hypothetical protein
MTAEQIEYYAVNRATAASQGPSVLLNESADAAKDFATYRSARDCLCERSLSLKALLADVISGRNDAGLVDPMR